MTVVEGRVLARPAPARPRVRDHSSRPKQRARSSTIKRPSSRPSTGRLLNLSAARRRCRRRGLRSPRPRRTGRSALFGGWEARMDRRPLPVGAGLVPGVPTSRRIFLRKEMVARLDTVRVLPKKPLRAQLRPPVVAVVHERLGCDQRAAILSSPAVPGSGTRREALPRHSS